MKKIFILMTCFLFTACGGGGGSSSSHNGEIELSGNIYNTYPDSKVSKAITFESVTTITNLGYISTSEMIQVSTIVTNSTLQDYSGLSVFIEIEDATFLTLEYWRCNKWYDSYSGDSSTGYEVWTEYEEPLSECEGEPKDPTIICDADVYDCENPYWVVDYTPPGDGLWKAQTSIPLLQSGETITNSVGYGNTGIDVRDDHQSRWYVKDNLGAILALKKYSFDVAL